MSNRQARFEDQAFIGGGLRWRLAIILIVFTILPGLIIAILGGYTSISSTQENRMENLQAIAVLKERQVRDWVEYLDLNLAAEVDRDAETRRLISLLRVAPDDTASGAPIYTMLTEQQVELFQSSILSRAVFEELFLMDQDGRVILSTDSKQVGKELGRLAYFRRAAEGTAAGALGSGESYINPPSMESGRETISIVIARPVLNEEGTFLGVLAGRASAEQLERIMLERSGLGQTGETYLATQDGILVTPTIDPTQVIGKAILNSEGLRRAALEEQNGTGEYANYAAATVLGAYRWIPELGVVLLAEQEVSEALRPIQDTLNIVITVSMLIVFVAAASAVLVGNNLAQPLVELTQALPGLAVELQSAELAALPQDAEHYDRGPKTRPFAASQDRERAAIQHLAASRSDEIGALANAFNLMSDQVVELFTDLEGRVTERTHLLQKRSEQLLAAGEVGRFATTILDRSQLMQRVVDLIRESFDLYYVGLFIVESREAQDAGGPEQEVRQWAILRAATGQAGVALLRRGHRLPVLDTSTPAELLPPASDALAGNSPTTQHSMIGWAITHGQPRITQNVSLDPLRLALADLPGTLSEAAIPLRSRGQILGALSLQSAHLNAFDQDTVAILQSMADQVAVALDNARLFDETQKALLAAEESYTLMSHQAWLEKLRSRPVGYYRSASGLAAFASTALADLTAHPEPAGPADRSKAANLVRLPIRARGRVIGYISARRPPSGVQPTQADPEQAAGAGSNRPDGDDAFSKAEMAVLETLSEQLGVALDSARLFEQTQQLAERERIVDQVTTRMRSTLDIATIIQTAASEFRRALELDEVEIRIGRQEEDGDVPRQLAEKAQHKDKPIIAGEPNSSQAADASSLQGERPAQASTGPGLGQAGGLLRVQTDLGYLASPPDKIVAVQGILWREEMLACVREARRVEAADGNLALPVKIRDQVAGVVRLHKVQPSSPDVSGEINRVPWGREEIELVEILCERLSSALESARLYDETRRRAERERLTAEITARLRASNDPQAILQTAAQELRRALQAKRAQLVVQEGAGQESSAQLGQAEPPTADQPAQKTQRKSLDRHSTSTPGSNKKVEKTQHKAEKAQHKGDGAQDPHPAHQKAKTAQDSHEPGEVENSG